MIDIYKAIPHRPPFLFVDRVIEISEEKIVAEKIFPPDHDFYKGHYPHFPVTPGVIVLESVFQAGAILLSQRIKNLEEGVPVLTRIRDAKFKKMARPGDRLELEAEIEDVISNAFYMKGRVRVDGGLVASVVFTCAFAPMDSAGEVSK